jgi:DNA-binding phage protein
MTLEQIERAMIEKAMSHHSGNITHVADALGLKRAALYRRLKKYGHVTCADQPLQVVSGLHPPLAGGCHRLRLERWAVVDDRG